MKKNVPLLTAVGALLLSYSCSVKAADSDWLPLKQFVPTTANAVLAIDAKTLFESEFAKKHGWRDLHQESFARNPMMLPPSAEQFILTAELDIEHLEPTRELAVITISDDVSIPEIKQQIGGDDDLIAGRRAIHTKRDSWIVPVAERQVAIVRLAQRQWASQQVRLGIERDIPEIPKLLDAAIQEVSNGAAQFGMAVILADAIPASEFRNSIERSTALRESGLDIDPVVAEMTSLEGLVFSVQVDDAIEGRLEMAFRVEPRQLEKVAKTFMLEVLSGAGATLPEFDNWQETHRPHHLGISGPMSVASLRRVLSLLNVSSSDVAPMVRAKPNKVPNVNPQAIADRATTEYVRRITALLHDIEAGAAKNSLRRQVLWTDRCAKTISRLPTRHVDSQVVELGQEVAYGLFDIVSTFQSAANEANYRARQENTPPVQWQTELIPYSTFVTPHGRFFRYAPFSYAQINVRENAIRSRAITTEELSNANYEAKETFARVMDTAKKMNQIADRMRPSNATSQ